MSVAAAASAAAAFPKIKARIELSRAKHRSLAGHSKMSRRVAKLLPFYEFEGDAYFACDGARPRRTSQACAGTASSASQAFTPSATPRAAR
ncbi:hypothetical protein ACVWZL_005569 [Bradyrhizobium sp. GM2.4]